MFLVRINRLRRKRIGVSGSVAHANSILLSHLFLLFTISILASPSSGNENNAGLQMICSEQEAFTITTSCHKFLTCLPRHNYSVLHCPTGQAFDASSQQCMPSKLVDCTKHRQPRVKKRAIHGIEIDVGVSSHSNSKNPKRSIYNLSRQKRRSSSRDSKNPHKGKSLISPTRPWGNWRGNDYIPYLSLLQIHDGKCDWPWPEDLTTESPTTSTTPEPTTSPLITSTIDDQEIPMTDSEEARNAEHINFGRKIGKMTKQEILKRKVHFKSEDFDAGAKDEERIYHKIAGNSQKIFTQTPNQPITVGYDESIETVTEADGPWVVTRIIKSRNRGLKPIGRSMNDAKRHKFKGVKLSKPGSSAG